MTRDRIEVVDGKLRFRVRSTISHSPTSHSFVLVHGIGTSHRYLTRLHDELAGFGDVHSVDLPGFGGMPRPPVAPDVHEMARALGAVLERLEVTHAVLVGHSMGAQWVTELAVLRPAVASGVVLIGPVADARHRSALAQGAALTLDVLGETPSANAIVFLDYIRCGPLWYARQLPHMLGYAIEDRVPSIAAPVLVMRGGNDPVAGLSWCRQLRDAAQHGTLVQVPGHRHVVQHTAARAVAAAITTCFAGSAVFARNR